MIPSPLQIVMWAIALGLVTAALAGLHDFIERGLERRRARIAWERLKKGSAR